MIEYQWNILHEASYLIHGYSYLQTCPLTTRKQNKLSSCSRNEVRLAFPRFFVHSHRIRRLDACFVNKTLLFAFFASVVIRDKTLLIVAIEDKNQLVVGNKVPHTLDVFPRVHVTQRNLGRLTVLSMNLCHEIERTTLYKIPSNTFALGLEGRRESKFLAK